MSQEFMRGKEMAIPGHVLASINTIADIGLKDASDADLNHAISYYMQIYDAHGDTSGEQWQAVAGTVFSALYHIFTEIARRQADAFAPLEEIQRALKDSLSEIKRYGPPKEHLS